MATLRPGDARKAIETFARLAGNEVTETREKISLRGRFPDAATVETFRSIQAAAALPWLYRVHISDRDDTTRAIDLAQPSFDADRDEVFLQIVKPIVDDHRFYFTVAGLKAALCQPREIETGRRILIAGTFTQFAAMTAEILAWTDQPLPPLPTKPDPLPDGRRLVRDLTHGTVSRETGFWVLKQKPALPSPEFQAWEAEATVELALLMANEVAESEGRIQVTFSGPRKEKVHLDWTEFCAQALFDPLNAAARWLLENPRETEIRHTLLSHEIAREWPPAARSLGAGIGQALGEALEAAQLAYRAHLLEKSRDSLKAIAELRRALGDETSRIADRARALITGLWRDAAVAAVALTIRMVTDFANPGSEIWVVRLILIVVAVVIFLSYSITIFLNREFLTSARAVRSTWRDKIYTLVGKEEYESLVDGPIRKDERTYHKTIWIVGVIYFLLICLLVVLAFPELGLAELLRDLLAVPPPATPAASGHTP